MKTQPSMQAVTPPSSRRINVAFANYSDFKFENEPTILHASKIIISEGLKPHRVVLRKNEGEYVTHLENVILEGDTWKHGDFYWGHYFNTDHASALRDFSERCAKL